MIILYLIVKGAPYRFPEWFTTFTFPPTVHNGFSSFTSLPGVESLDNKPEFVLGHRMEIVGNGASNQQGLIILTLWTQNGGGGA